MFGKQPKIGWTIDPFGHSKTNIKLYAEMGFDAVFLTRVDRAEEAERRRNGEMEFVWESSGSSIFTHVFYGPLYQAPKGFGFDPPDSAADDAFWINNAAAHGYNAPAKAKLLLAHLKKRQKCYQSSSDMLVLFGDDFRYESAHHNFEYLDNMIEYMNKHHGDQYHFKYSTPSDYIAQVNKMNTTWPTKSDDMFPYSDSQE